MIIKKILHHYSALKKQAEVCMWQYHVLCTGVLSVHFSATEASSIHSVPWVSLASLSQVITYNTYLEDLQFGHNRWKSWDMMSFICLWHKSLISWNILWKFLNYRCESQRTHSVSLLKQCWRAFIEVLM